MVSAKWELTIESRWASKAWTTERGRLSVVFGLSRRVRPVVLRVVGIRRVVSIRGMRSSRDSSQVGWRRARTWRVKPW